MKSIAPFTVFLIVLSMSLVACRSSDPHEGRCPAGVGACVEAYGVELPRPRPIERFELRIAQLEERVRGKRSFNDIVERFDSSKVRRLLVQFQALFKVYEQIPANSESLQIIDRGRRDLKVLEDVIGDLQRIDEVAKRARKANLSERILAMLVVEEKSVRERSIEKLRVGGWLPYPLQHLREFRSRIEAYDFKRKKKDQRAQIEALARLVKNARRDLTDRDDYFVSKKMTEDELDGGIHEVRRALRWILAIIQASDGLYRYRPTLSTSPEMLELEQAYGGHEYLDLAPPIKGAVELNRRDLLLLSKYVMEFGTLKNFKEGQLDLRDFIVANKLEGSKEAERIALGTMTEKYGPLEIEKMAKALYRDYIKEDPLRSLLNSIEDAIKRLDQEKQEDD